MIDSEKPKGFNVMDRRYNWSDEDINYCYENKDKLSAKQISKNLNKNINEIWLFYHKNNIKKNSSSVIREQFKSGRVHPQLNKSLSKEHKEKLKLSRINKDSWNSGLNAETDNRVKKNSENMKKTKQSNEWKSTIGKSCGEKLSKIRKEQYSTGKLIHPMIGKNKENSDWAKNSSERMKFNNPMFNKEVVNRANSEENMKKRFQKMLIRPTKPERIISNLIKKNNLPFIYTGNGSIIIGGFNPDFLSKELKKIIEINGDYWHNLPKCVEKDKRKLEIYSKMGYKTLVIWEHEIEEDKELCLKKINNFTSPYGRT